MCDVVWCGAVVVVYYMTPHNTKFKSYSNIHIWSLVHIFKCSVDIYHIAIFFCLLFFDREWASHSVVCAYALFEIEYRKGRRFFFHAILFLFLKPRNAHFSSSAFYLSTFEMGLLFIFVVAARRKKKSLHGPSAAYRCRWQPVCAVRLMREIQFRYCMIAHSTVSYDISSSVASLFSQISCTCLK